jgi:hypothetical protein
VSRPFDFLLGSREQRRRRSEVVSRPFDFLLGSREHGASPFATSTDLFLASALAMAFFTPCSAILTQSYGKSIGLFWLIFA